MSLRACDWEVQPIGRHGDASRPIILGHYAKSVPNTSTYRHGLYRRDDPLPGDPLGVALWIPPTKGAAQTIAGDAWGSVLCLSRFFVDETVPLNGASYLLGRSMRLIDRRRWPYLLTYADTALGHDGTIYKATNWTCLGAVPAGDVWLGPSGEQRGRKRGGRTLTVAEMLAAGFTRKAAAPKIKYVRVARGHALIPAREAV